MNVPDNFSESLEAVFWVKNTCFPASKHNAETEYSSNLEIKIFSSPLQERKNLYAGYQSLTDIPQLPEIREELRIKSEPLPSSSTHSEGR